MGKSSLQVLDVVIPALSDIVDFSDYKKYEKCSGNWLRMSNPLGKP